jgi:Flp pilus assembly protein TadG
VPHRDERGLSESVQFAVVWPVLMLVTLGVLQAGLWLHGRNVAQRAATAAVDTARGTAGSVDAARDLATDLARTGGLDEVSVQVTRGPTTTTATVTAGSPLLLNFGLGRLRESATAPVERATPP